MIAPSETAAGAGVFPATGSTTGSRMGLTFGASVVNGVVRVITGPAGTVLTGSYPAVCVVGRITGSERTIGSTGIDLAGGAYHTGSTCVIGAVGRTGGAVNSTFGATRSGCAHSAAGAGFAAGIARELGASIAEEVALVPALIASTGIPV